jgi:hypothetical protein
MKKTKFSRLFSNTRDQQIKTEPCSELELIAIRACAATLCCGTIKDEWFQKTVVPWLDQFMAAHEVRNFGFSWFFNYIFISISRYIHYML